MSIEATADFTYATARQQWQAADQAARLAYVGRVKQLQAQYEEDCRPFRDVYDHGERAAWQEYQQRGRDNWAAYRTLLNLIDVPDSPSGITDSPTEGNQQ